MEYDYIIVGAGIAGTVCSYLLSKKNKKCLLVEQYGLGHEKICGGGVSYDSLEMLKSIGINIDLIFDYDISVVKGHKLYFEGKEITKNYENGRVSIGIQRNILDGFLIEEAKKEGVDMVFDQKVASVSLKNGRYILNDFSAKHIVWAIGARTIKGSIPKFQSIGYSGQIKAKSRLANDIFHYWYYDADITDKYFWAFPIGIDLWNVGVWNRTIGENIKIEYEKCIEKYFINNVIGEFEYYRTPKGEYLGHFDQREKNTLLENGLGDFAGCCNPNNGGGIHKAIKSAINFAQEV